jgi:hypothetical protein
LQWVRGISASYVAFGLVRTLQRESGMNTMERFEAILRRQRRMFVENLAATTALAGSLCVSLLALL